MQANVSFPTTVTYVLC